MKLKIIGGEIEVEIVEKGKTISDIKLLLKKMSEEENGAPFKMKRIAGTKFSPHSSKSDAQDKLNVKPKMPI